MSPGRESDLLVELARLVRKYGLETFERLVSRLEDPEFIVQLKRTMVAAGELSRDLPGGHHSDRVPSLGGRSLVREIEALEPEKKEILLPFYEGLMNRVFLPTLGDLRSFSAENGLPPIRAASREKAVVPFVKSLLPVSSGELRIILSKIRPGAVSGDRSLEEWSRVIFRDRK